MATNAPKSTPPTLVILAIVTLARLVINIGRRFVYPFLPIIARQLGVPIYAVQNAVAIQGGVGIFSPMIAPIADQVGHKRTMLFTLSLMVIGCLVGLIFPQFIVFAGVLIFIGVIKMIYDPAMQSYLADLIPYERRGMAIGISELSWAGALLFTAPVVGFILNRAGVNLVYGVLGLVLMLTIFFMARFLPSDYYRSGSRERFHPLRSLRILATHSHAKFAVLFSLIYVAANEMILINYAVWLESKFDLSLEALGAATIAIGAAEISGEFFIIFFSDRLGKQVLAVIAAIISSLCYIVLPLAASFVMVLGILYVTFICVEIAIVASISFFTEIMPKSRAVMMSGNVAAHALGRLTGGVMGGGMVAAGLAFEWTGAAALFFGLVSVGMLWLATQHVLTPVVQPVSTN